MPTNFPTNPDSYTTKVDGVDTVMAAHINDLQDAMMAVQDFALDLGKWQSYTPTWTAATTNPSIGNGTLTGRYIVIGKLCTYVLGMVMGSTTTYGSGDWAFSLPINAMNTAGIYFYGVAHLRKSGIANYERIAEIVPANSVSVIKMFTDPTPGSNSSKISATVPFTWGEGDAFRFEITYEIA